MSDLYSMIFKRKSFHIFSGRQHLLDNELDTIKNKYKSFTPLYSDIKTDIVITKRTNTTCKRGEYCILLYSEKKDNYLQNIGYIGEQLDLWLTKHNIGVCWYGMGKVSEKDYNGLSFVIMLTIERVDESEFRKDMFSSKRKNVNEIWHGNDYNDISNIVRFSPSACNTQPWYVYSDNNILSVYRYKKQGKRGLMPIERVCYYNRIDIGIFMLFLELCLNHNGIKFERHLFTDNGSDNIKTLVAKYKLLNGNATSYIDYPVDDNDTVNPNILISNIDKINTTVKGVDRICKNLKLEIDPVIWCKNMVRDKNSIITKEGKNWYVINDIYLITINSSNYSIVTAHRKRRR